MPQSVPICHYCTKNYSKDPPLIPLLLNCGHSYCEGCISRFGRLIKFSGNITCPECSEYHYIESMKSIKQLQINAHIYGVICAPNRKKENAVDSIVHSDLTNKLADIARQQSSDDEDPQEESSEDYVKCCECKAKSDLNCDDCSLPYCAACSARAHQLVALCKHSPAPILPKPLFECRYHPGVVPTQFLVEDKKLVCPECPTPGETVDILCEASHVEDLKQQLNLARETLEKTDTTITSDLIPTVEQDYLRLKSEVRKEFGYFHGLLQAREQALLDELETKQMQTVQPLLDFRSEIVKSTKAASKDFNWIMRNKGEKNVLVKKQEHVQEIKKGIDAIKSTLFVMSEKRPTITTKQAMMSRCITEFCKVNADGVHQYFMDTIECTTARKYHDDVPLYTPPVENEWESPVLNKSHCLSVSSEPGEPLTVTLAVAENRDKVVVSMVYSPHYFYVQKTKDRDNLDELQNILVKYYGLSYTPEDYLKTVSPGDLVCGQYTMDELWYRARVLHVDNGMVNVLYIDYGNSELVPPTRLRRLKTKFTHCPELAIKCALYGITPRDGQAWTEEAIESLKRLTTECELEMITKGKVQDFTEVDLLQCGSDIGSTREFLVFLEHACFSTNKAITNVDEGSEELDQVIELDSVQVEPKELLWPDTEEYILVKVSHIESPFEFFVQLNSNEEVLQKIGSEISLHMGSVGKKFPLKELKKGVMCLALYPGDGNFYRAVILGAVDFHVHVFYCDYGNSDSVQRGDMYEVPASLAVDPRLSITCSLYGIGPVSNGPDQGVWSAPEIGLFEQLVAEKQVFATRKGAESGRTEISLTDTTQSSQDVDIANEMIFRGYGVSTLPPVQHESSAPFGEISLGPVKTSRGATICHVTSPHLINVNLVDMPYPPFFQKLNAAYSRFVKTGNRIIERDTSWNTGDMCVAYLSDMELFIRAKISSFTIPQSAMVENVDQGRITKVSLNDLKVLIEDFSLVQTPKFVVVCKLFDVMPPNGTDWTPDQNKKVLRYFSRKVKKGKASCFVTVMGERESESGSYPVDMMLLDPAANTRERVSDELVKLGLANLLVDKVEAPKGDYKQVEQLTLLDRRGKVIYVSANCTMYFTPDSMRPETERLAGNLLRFKENPADVEWRVGAACVAKSDKWFYRGIVTNIIGTKILDIHLVDTGTVQQLHVQHVFPTLLCPDIPMLAVPLHLAYIQPAWHSSDGSWSSAASYYLYETVVNEKCEIDVVSKGDRFYNVTMRLISGEKVGECMVSKGYAVSCSPQSTSPPPASPRTNSTVALPPQSLGLSSPSGSLPPSLPPSTGSFSPLTNTSGDRTPGTLSIDGC